MSIKNKDNGSFETLCLILLTLMTSWPSFESSFLSSSMSAEWCMFRRTTRKGLSCLSWYVWKLAFRVLSVLVSFLYASGFVGSIFTLLLFILRLYSSLQISLSRDLIIVCMSMTSSTNIGGGGGVLCACWFGGGSTISMASFEDSNTANLL